MQTLVDLLHDLTTQHPDQVAYTFLENGDQENDTLTYRQLDEKARQAGRAKQSAAAQQLARICG